VSPTIVDFPAGVLEGTGVVQRVVPLEAGVAVITDRTPFHPVDPSWPDQPADLGTLDGAPVVDCLVATVAADGSVTVGENIRVRRGESGYDWVVAHVLDGAGPAVGESVALRVDPQRRAALSRAHTGCHVSALALNAVVADLWRKEVPLDGIGNPDFDRIALTESRMVPDEARDTYRLGKSLRKKGFDSAGLLADLEGVATRVEQQVRQWQDADSTVEIEVTGPQLTDLRYWVCHVPQGTFRIACGGTHVTALRELGDLRVRYEQPDVQTVVAVTTVGF
jgi:alanyl-tRNA synthetase